MPTQQQEKQRGAGKMRQLMQKENTPNNYRTGHHRGRLKQTNSRAIDGIKKNHLAQQQRANQET